jgi:hypothetical protein
MLIIRKAQMEALNARLVQDFENQVLADLEERFPARCREMGEASLRRLIQAGIRKAGGYGIEAQDDVARVIEVMFEFGENFDERADLAWPCQSLRDPSLTGDVKTGLLVARLAARKRRCELSASLHDSA